MVDSWGEIPIDSRFEDSDSSHEGYRTDTTTSITSVITQYRYENGRRYHAYRDGEYWGPNDEKACEHLDIAHHLYLLTLDNALFLTPIGDSPKRVLDVGTGTGIWAIDFADQFPSAHVVGVDLSPIQPSYIPPNLEFEIDDLSGTWTYPPNSFSFIHVRGLYGCVADWPAFFQEAFNALEPGGWIEQVEMSVVPQCDDGSIADDHIFAEWGRVSLEAGDKFGKSLRIHEQSKGFMEAGGFQNVTERVFKWPMGPWSSDCKLKTLGYWNRLHWEHGMEGWCLALLTRVMGWSYTEVQAYLGKMRLALRDPSVHAYQVLNVVSGQKIVGAETKDS